MKFESKISKFIQVGYKSLNIEANMFLKALLT